uniref:Multidrug resistance efflux transporter n=1 Tax=Neospora caninum (strain Liverpool) TaxID=572307 RepID=A0A0F7U929_NEOCL|nr:TPA: hypothetical protein BN1204_014120 [Neospora caninum Liverpool]
MPPDRPVDSPRWSPTPSDAASHGDAEEVGYRREQSTLFPPLTNSPLTLHSYKDSSVSSLLFGLLCCLLNIALYLVSGEISRLLQQERELQRHQSLHYVCPPLVGEESGLPGTQGSSDTLTRDANRDAPCTIPSGDTEVKTRVVVLNIPYFMSWFSQSLQVCFLFFAIAAIKRRRRRHSEGNPINPLPSRRHTHGCGPSSSVSSEGGSGGDCRPLSPLGNTQVVQFAEEVRERDSKQTGHFSLDRNECEIPANARSDEAGRRQNPQRPIIPSFVDKSEGPGHPDERSCSALKARPSAENDAEDHEDLARTQQLPCRQLLSCTSPNTTSDVLGDLLGYGSVEKDLHQPLISGEACTAVSGLVFTRTATEKDVSDFIEQAFENEDCTDPAETVPWEANIEDVLLCTPVQEPGEAPMPSEDAPEPQALATRRQNDSDTCAERETVAQPQVVQREDPTLPEDSKCSRFRTLFASWSRAIGRGLTRFAAEVLEPFWIHSIQHPFSRFIGAPLRQRICTPYIRDTYQIVRNFVEADMQYSSFKELVWACMWIGALYLLHSWAWTLAVGKDGMSVGTVTAIYNTNPVFVFLFTAFLYKEGTDDCVQIAALALATLGVAVIAYHNEGEPTSTSGVFLSVACAACYGLFEVVYKNYILNGKSNLPLAFVFLINGIIGMLSLCVFWIPLAFLHSLSLEVFPGSTPPPLLIFLLVVVCVCSCLHTLLLQVSLLLLPSPILVALCSLLSLPAAAAADWLSGGGGGVGGIGSCFIASAFLITSVNEWRIQSREKARTYRRLISLAELHPHEYAELRKLMELPDLPQPRSRRRTCLFGRTSSEAEPSEDSEPSLESIAAQLVARKKDEDVGAELKEVLCVFTVPDDDEILIAEDTGAAL